MEAFGISGVIAERLKRAQSGLRGRVMPALACSWRGMSDDGWRSSVSNIARPKQIDRTHARDALQMTLLAPEIVEATLGGEAGRQLLKRSCRARLALSTLRHVQLGAPLRGRLSRNPWIRDQGRSPERT